MNKIQVIEFNMPAKFARSAHNINDYTGVLILTATPCIMNMPKMDGCKITFLLFRMQCPIFLKSLLNLTITLLAI